MDNIQTFIKESDDFKSIINGLHEGLKEQPLAGLSGSARSVFTSALANETNKPIFLITHNLYQAQKVTDDLTALLEDRSVLCTPSMNLFHQKSQSQALNCGRAIRCH